MFLSRFDINPMRRDARRLLGNPQAMHASVMKACSSGNSQESGRVLWRVDEGADQVTLYLVSPNVPDLSELHEVAGWPEQGPGRVANYDTFLNGLQPAQRYAFRVTANPTHVATEDGKKKRYGHVTVEQQRQWLLERAEPNGFTVGSTSQGGTGAGFTDLVVRDRTVRTFRREGRPVTLSLATFLGSLTVSDPDALRSALTHGIGRAKAYGCGLLTLARLP